MSGNTMRRRWVLEGGKYACNQCGFFLGTAEEMLDHLQQHRKEGVRVANAELADLQALVCKEHSYDEQCLELAGHFCADYPKAKEFDTRRLAQHIQEAVEDWLRGHGLEP